jgi:hypothetical protein
MDSTTSGSTLDVRRRGPVDSQEKICASGPTFGKQYDGTVMVDGVRWQLYASKGERCFVRFASSKADWSHFSNAVVWLPLLNPFGRTR